MKELSIEAKAKAYDELLIKLQKAKVDNNVCDERYCCVIDDIVPELKESEDERIRKMLIEFFGKGAEYNGSTNGISDKEVLAWLEKQGEQKPAWSEEDEKILSDIIKDLVHPWNEYIPDRIEDEIKWLKNRLKSPSPKNRWKPSDEMLEALDIAIRAGIQLGTWEETSLRELQKQLKKLREE